MQIGRIASVVVAVGAVAAPRAAAADTYIVPSDYGVACLKLDSGRVLWRRPGKLTRPVLRLRGDAVVAEDPPDSGSTARLIVDRRSGKPTRLGKGGAAVAAVSPLAEPRQFRGEAIAFDQGNTRHIETAAGKVLRHLDWFPSNVLVHGDRALVTLHDGKGGAEVFAWDLAAKAPAWEIDLHDHVPGLREGAYIDIALDGDHLLIAVDQNILAFDIATPPRLLWKVGLPAQSIRRYDAAWTRFARSGDIVFARVYEDLFALAAADGKILWRFDAGMLGDPWPLVHAGRVYVSYRAGEVEQQSFTLTGSGDKARVSALEIRRTGKRWTITPLARATLPDGVPVWSSLHPPPRDRRSTPRTQLTLRDDDEQIWIDLTPLASSRGPIYVKFHGMWERAELIVSGHRVATATWD